MAAQTSPLDLYDNIDVIGTGSFGVIRMVSRKGDGKIFACKELNFDKMTERDRKQIVAEVNILKELQHDNIVGYVDRYIDRERGILFILMEYCGGGDLGSIIKQCQRAGKQIPEDNIWSYLLQILFALEYCHAPGGRASSSSAQNATLSNVDRKNQILHRDIKPENVFLAADHSVKLGDFGLSKALSTASTFANTYVGTPYYMSPELIDEKGYDSKSDIWSLGCLIYELCALKPPFHEAQTHQQLATYIRKGRIPPLPRGYSTALASCIKSMLNINPALRPSAHQLLQNENVRKAQEQVAMTKKGEELNVQKDKLDAREVLLAQREIDLQQHIEMKEAELRREVALKDSEIVEREAQMRARFAQWEQDVQLGQQRQEEAYKAREDALRAEVLEWQRQVKTQWDIKEAEFLQETSRLQEELRQQKAKYEGLISESVVGKKLPFQDVRNTMNQENALVSEVEALALETPVNVKDGSMRGRQKSRFRTPLAFGKKMHSKARSEPQSAIKEVALSPMAVDTPSPNHLVTLLNNSPVRDFKGFAKLKAEYGRTDCTVDEPPSSPEDERPRVDFADSPSVAPASRLRKPSLVNLKFRPVLNTAASCPGPAVNNPDPDRLPNEATVSLPPSVKVPAPVVTQTQTALQQSEDDDLPSPFLKRVERTKSKTGSRRTSEASKALRAAAAVNAASKPLPGAPSAPPSIVPTRSSGRVSISPDAQRARKLKQ